MNPVAIKNWSIAIVALLGLFLIYKLYQWIKTKGISGVAADTASAFGDIVGGTATGAVTGIAKTVGIPNTSQDQCAIDQAAGKLWDASFDCSAPVFIKGLFGKPNVSLDPLANYGGD